jgi:hypothetical protein
MMSLLAAEIGLPYGTVATAVIMQDRYTRRLVARIESVA